MKFDHSFKHHDVSQSLISYLEDKMNKLLKFEIKPGTAHVTYGSQRHQCFVEINLMGGESIFKARGVKDDWYRAVDHALQRLESQMKKRKSVVKGHRHPERSKRGRLALVNAQLESDYTRLDEVALHKKAS